jgi:hypothetical protein
MTKQRLRANDDTHLAVVGFNKGARGGIVKVVNNGQADFTIKDKDETPRNGRCP